MAKDFARVFPGDGSINARSAHLHMASLCRDIHVLRRGLVNRK